MIHPVGMRGEGFDQLATGGIPDFDRLVVRGCVDVSCTAPPYAGYRALVAGEDEFDAFGDRVPHSDC